MNKKHQTKLEDIECEVDSFKKKRGRPVGSKKSSIKKDMEKLNKINKGIRKASHELLALYPAKKYLEEIAYPTVDGKVFNTMEEAVGYADKIQKEYWDTEWDNIEVPTLRKQPKSKVPLTAKITLVVMVFIIGVLLLA